MPEWSSMEEVRHYRIVMFSHQPNYQMNTGTEVIITVAMHRCLHLGCVWSGSPPAPVVASWLALPSDVCSSQASSVSRGHYSPRPNTVVLQEHTVYIPPKQR